MSKSKSAKPFSRYVIPTVSDRPVEISGPSTESLKVFLSHIGDERIAALIGKEKEVSWSMVTDDRLEGGRFFLQITEGQKFDFAGGRSRQGGRWLVHDVQGGDGVGAGGMSSQICCALNYTVDHSPADDGKRASKLTIISNLIVREDHQGLGLAGWVVKSFMAAHPRARIDTCLTTFGARFFGFDENGQRQQPSSPATGHGNRPGKAA